MKKIYKVWMTVVALLMLLAVCIVPAFAEDAGGGELPPVEDTGGGEDVPEEMPEEGPDDEETGGASPSPSEDEGAKWSMEEIDAYINGTVIPAAVMVVTALATLYVALMPIIHKVKKSSDKFDQASDDITATAGESELTKKNTKAALDKLSGEYTELLAQNKQLQENYKALEAVVTAALADMKANVSGEMAAFKSMAVQIEKMLIVGFCNNKELMDKGYARKIAELGAGIDVGASGEKEEDHEQDNIEGNA